MSFDLIIDDFRPGDFVPDDCCDYVDRCFYFGLRFPQGYDAAADSGWLPLQVEFDDADGWFDTGFEVYPDSENKTLGFSVPAGADRLSLGVAHALAAYCLTSRGATVEDPQEGSVFKSRNKRELHRRVFEFFLDPGGVDLRRPSATAETADIEREYQRLTELSASLTQLRTTDPRQAAELASSTQSDARRLFEDALLLACEAAEAGYDLDAYGTGAVFWLERICESMEQWFTPGSDEMIAERKSWARQLAEAEEDELAGNARVMRIEARLDELGGRELLARGNAKQAFEELERAFVLECLLKDDAEYGDFDGRGAEIAELLKTAGAQTGRPYDWDPRTDPKIQAVARPRDSHTSDDSPPPSSSSFWRRKRRELWVIVFMSGFLVIVVRLIQAFG